jgi:hypothetical protein
MGLEQVEVLNEILYSESIGEFSLDNDSFFDSDYAQLVLPRTH